MPKYRCKNCGHRGKELIFQYNEGKSVYHRTEGTVICEKCFKHYNGYGHDKNGHWKIPKNEDLTNLKSVCRECVNKILKNRKTNYDF